MNTSTDDTINTLQVAGSGKFTGALTATGLLTVSSSGITSSSASVDILKPTVIGGGAWDTINTLQVNGSAKVTGAITTSADVIRTSFNTNTTAIIGIDDASANAFVNSNRGNLLIKSSSAISGANAMGGGDLTLRAGNSFVGGASETNGDVLIASGYNLGAGGNSTYSGKITLNAQNTDVAIFAGTEIELKKSTTITGALTTTGLLKVSSGGIDSSSASVDILKQTVIGGGAWDTINTLQVTGSASITGGVNTDNVTVKNRLYTGVADASGNAIVASTGITPAKILSIRCYYFTGACWSILTTGDTNEVNSIRSDGLIDCRGRTSSIGQSYRMYVTYEA